MSPGAASVQTFIAGLSLQSERPLWGPQVCPWELKGGKKRWQQQWLLGQGDNSLGTSVDVKWRGSWPLGYEWEHSGPAPVSLEGASISGTHLDPLPFLPFWGDSLVEGVSPLLAGSP